MAKAFKADPAFNLKTGADSEFYYAREVTKKGEDLGKIKIRDGLYRYPVLSRCTGNSLKGTAESIESNELRKGRTKSAPRKGNESSEGSLDFEFSPTTYDDMLEAAFRNNWRRWKSDSDSETNKKDNDGYKQVFADGYFSTACGKKGSKRLIRFEGDDNDNDDNVGLILVPRGSVVDELTCGTVDIKYDGLRRYGGVENEDIYQDFQHLAVNTVSLNVEVNAIVTGSVGFMGANDPLMRQVDEIVEDYGGLDVATNTYKTDRFLGDLSSGKKYIDNLPEKATNTDQFTAREGFLRLNGKLIEFATGIDMEVNNGLEKKFAIFVKNAIATTPLSLDITGSLKVYLIDKESDKIFNSAVKDEDNEILFTFRDKDTDPRYLYVVQIFKTKFTEHDSSVSGKDVIELSLPYSSFEERAVRMFRIVLPQEVSVKMPYAEDIKGDAPAQIIVTPNVPVQKADISTFKVAVSVDDVPLIDDFVANICETKNINGLEDENYGKIVVTKKTGGNIVERTKKDQRVSIHIKWNGVESDTNILVKRDVVIPPQSLTTTANSASITLDPVDNVEVTLGATDENNAIYDDDLTYEVVTDVGGASGTDDLTADASKAANIDGDKLSIPTSHDNGTVSVRAVFRKGLSDEVVGTAVAITVLPVPVSAITAKATSGGNNVTGVVLDDTNPVTVDLVAIDQLDRDVTNDTVFTITSDLGVDGTTDVASDASKSATVSGTTLSVPADRGNGKVAVKATYTKGTITAESTIDVTVSTAPVTSVVASVSDSSVSLGGTDKTVTMSAVDQNNEVLNATYTIVSDVDANGDAITTNGASIAGNVLIVPSGHVEGKVTITASYTKDSATLTSTPVEVAIVILVTSITLKAQKNGADVTDATLSDSVAEEVQLVVSDQIGRAVTSDVTYTITEDQGGDDGTTDVTSDVAKAASIVSNAVSFPCKHGAGSTKVKAVYMQGTAQEHESEITITVNAYTITDIITTATPNAVTMDGTNPSSVVLSATDLQGVALTAGVTYSIVSDKDANDSDITSDQATIAGDTITIPIAHASGTITAKASWTDGSTTLEKNVAISVTV